MPLSAELSATDVTVAPGDELLVHLTVRNLGDNAETVAIVVTGMCQGWTHVEPPSASLFPGEEQRVEVHLRPPRSPAVSSGANALALRVVPHGSPDDALTVEGVVHVLAFSDRRVTVLQPVLRGKRSAEYDVVVENLGNTMASCRLQLSDPARKLAGRFEPPSIGVEPGRNSATTVRVRARGRRWRGSTGSYPFEVTAVQEGHPSASASATFLQSTMISATWWRPVAAAAAVLALLAAAWFGLVRPEIERAAEQATETLPPPETVPIITAPGVTAPTTAPPPDATDTPPDTAPAGELFAFRLPVQVPVGSTATQDFDAPPGTRLEITDIVLQNPNGDLGQARLLRNDDVLLSWRLDNIIGDDVKQYVSPYELRTGDRLSFEVTCAGAGDPTVASCTPSVSVTGRLFRP